MGKIIYIVLSIIVIGLILFGLDNSYTFSEWIILDIIVAILLTLKGIFFNFLIKDKTFWNINYMLVIIMILAYMLHFKYSLWVIIDYLIIIGQIVSPIILIIILKENKNNKHIL